MSDYLSNYLPNVPRPILGLLGGAFILVLIKRLASKPKYLPGPPGLLVIGNLLQIPATNSWEQYTKWREEYGDAIHLSAMGSSIVVLNSYQACIDLLEKRSDIYSDRPTLMMACQLMGWVKSVTLAPYGDRWRRYRRIMASSMRRAVVHQFSPGQEKEVKRFLPSLLTEPEKYMANFRFCSGRGIMKNMYGIELQSASDEIIRIADEAMQHVTYAATPGTFMVDFFPFMQYIPSWFPGAGFQKFAKRGKRITEEMNQIPFDQTKAAMRSGSYEPSFTSVHLEANEDEDIVKWCSATMYTAGIDTTVSTMHNMFLAIVLNPECLRRAHTEIDAVIGTERLPTMADRPDLPYVNALMKEVMRWQPVNPLALPHALTKDDVYQGCFLPGGATVLGNTWAITRDPELYENPESFNPDRFLPLFDKSIKCDKLPLDPVNYAFGFGRRICAGMHYADTMLFIAMACILAAFDIAPIKDENGNEVRPELRFNSHIVREALPFECSITPRPHGAAIIAAAQINV